MNPRHLDVPPQKSTTKVEAAPFLKKTYEMVEDASTNDYVAWGDDGTSFVIWKPNEFSSNILPRFFKHSNLSSFVRQLNIYGFKKVHPDRWEFIHENFIRDRPDCLREISRRKQGNNSNPAPMLNGQKQQQVMRDLPIDPIDSEDLRETVEKLRKDKDVLVVEILQQRKRQSEIVNYMRKMNSELHRWQSKQNQTQETLDKIVGFLSSALGKTSLIENNPGGSPPGRKKRRNSGDSSEAPSPSDGSVYASSVSTVSERCPSSANMFNQRQGGGQYFPQSAAPGAVFQDLLQRFSASPASSTSGQSPQYQHNHYEPSEAPIDEYQDAEELPPSPPLDSAESFLDDTAAWTQLLSSASATSSHPPHQQKDRREAPRSRSTISPTTHIPRFDVDALFDHDKEEPFDDLETPLTDNEFTARSSRIDVSTHQIPVTLQVNPTPAHNPFGPTAYAQPMMSSRNPVPPASVPVMPSPFFTPTPPFIAPPTPFVTSSSTQFVTSSPPFVTSSIPFVTSPTPFVTSSTPYVTSSTSYIASTPVITSVTSALNYAAPMSKMPHTVSSPQQLPPQMDKPDRFVPSAMPVTLPPSIQNQYFMATTSVPSLPMLYATPLNIQQQSMPMLQQHQIPQHPPTVMIQPKMSIPPSPFVLSPSVPVSQGVVGGVPSLVRQPSIPGSASISHLPASIPPQMIPPMQQQLFKQEQQHQQQQAMPLPHANQHMHLRQAVSMLPTAPGPPMKPMPLMSHPATCESYISSPPLCSFPPSPPLESPPLIITPFTAGSPVTSSCHLETPVTSVVTPVVNQGFGVPSLHQEMVTPDVDLTMNPGLGIAFETPLEELFDLPLTPMGYPPSMGFCSNSLPTGLDPSGLGALR